MAISPNTDFTAGAVLTASQQNRFPRGVVSYVEHTANVGFTTETTIMTAPAFTAVANRYYKITFFEPSLSNTTIGTSTLKIKQGATIIQQGIVANVAATTGYAGSISTIETFTAGTINNITATAQSSATGSAQATTSSPGYLLIEDIGPA